MKARPFYWLCLVLRFTVTTTGWSLVRSGRRGPATPSVAPPPHRFYDVIIVGAGAGGLFASGAAQLFGRRTALIETGNHTGGDCTNAACVPSKALRAAARQSSWTLDQAREYVAETVQRVRKREDPDAIQDRSQTLDLFMVNSCRFTSPCEVEVSLRNGNATKHSKDDLLLQGGVFILATGASPVVPPHLQKAAHQASIPLYTYKTLLSPEGDPGIWNMESIAATAPGKKGPNTIVIVGGGATGLELGQSLALLSGEKTIVHLAAPEILPDEDVRLRDSALRILENAGIVYHRGRLDDIGEDKILKLDNGAEIVNTDYILLCMGRSPVENLQKLDLDKANVASTSDGVAVYRRSLRSTTNPRFFAVGDCSSAVPRRFRTATHAAWTSFHAVRNAVLPRPVWIGSSSVHPCVPRVIDTEPELSCVGMTHVECVQKFGTKGFHSVSVPEIGNDRADIERVNRDTSVSFVEVRAEPGTGRILGASFCGPAAAELANTVGMAIVNRLTVGGMARSLYSYPSHGYLLHRIALSMFLSDAKGLLEVGGPFPGLLAKLTRWIQGRTRVLVQFVMRIIAKRATTPRRVWEVEGARNTIHLPETPDLDRRIVSFQELKSNSTLLEAASELSSTCLDPYRKWAKREFAAPSGIRKCLS